MHTNISVSYFFFATLLLVIVCTGISCDLLTTDTGESFDFFASFPSAQIVPETGGQGTPTGKIAFVQKGWEIGGKSKDALIVLAAGKLIYDVPAGRAGDRLVFSGGMRLLLGDGATGMVLVQLSTRLDTLYKKFLNPVDNVQDRKWFDASVDLSRYKGFPIKIIFATDAGPKGDGTADWFAFGDPILTY